MSIILRVTDELHSQFKGYVQKHNTSMSKILVDYITKLVAKPGKVPAKEKNSVKKTALTTLYHCPYCGKDITSLIPIDRLTHLQNCKNGRNR